MKKYRQSVFFNVQSGGVYSIAGCFNNLIVLIGKKMPLTNCHYVICVCNEICQTHKKMLPQSCC